MGKISGTREGPVTQYDLYRDLVRAIYALALDAVQSRDLDKLSIAASLTRSAFEPLRKELGEHTPVFGIIEYLDVPKSVDEEWWSMSFDNLTGLQETYREVLG